MIVLLVWMCVVKSVECYAEHHWLYHGFAMVSWVLVLLHLLDVVYAHLVVPRE